MIATLLLAMLAVQDAPYNGAECDQAAADRGLQIDLNICAYHEFAEADAELNAAWRVVAAKAKQNDERLAEYPDGDAGYFETLLEGQRAWLTYRDAHCRMSAFDARGGSMQPMLYSLCRANVTRARTQELQELTSNQIVG